MPVPQHIVHPAERAYGSGNLYVLLAISKRLADGQHLFELGRRSPRRALLALVAEQGRHDLFEASHITIHAVDAAQDGHAAIARPLRRREQRPRLLVIFQQRHAFAIGGRDEQLAFFLRGRHGQIMQEVARLRPELLLAARVAD